VLPGHTAPHHTNSDLFASSAFRAAHGVYDFIIEVYKHITLQAGRTMATEETVCTTLQANFNTTKNRHDTQKPHQNEA